MCIYTYLTRTVSFIHKITLLNAETQRNQPRCWVILCTIECKFWHQKMCGRIRRYMHRYNHLIIYQNYYKSHIRRYSSRCPCFLCTKLISFQCKIKWSLWNNESENPLSWDIPYQTLIELCTYYCNHVILF